MKNSRGQMPLAHSIQFMFFYLTQRNGYQNDPILFSSILAFLPRLQGINFSKCPGIISFICFTVSHIQFLIICNEGIDLLVWNLLLKTLPDKTLWTMNRFLSFFFLHGRVQASKTYKPWKSWQLKKAIIKEFSALGPLCKYINGSIENFLNY